MESCARRDAGGWRSSAPARPRRRWRRACGGQNRHGLELVGFIATPESGGAPEPMLGTVDDVPRLVSSGVIDDVILASESSPWQTRLIDALAKTAQPSSNVWLLPGPFESLIAGTRFSWVDDHPLIEVARDPDWRINWPLKRVFDVVVGGLLLIAALAGAPHRRGSAS